MRPRTLFIAVLLALPLATPAIAGKATEESREAITRLLGLMDYGADVGETRFFEMKTGDIISLPFPADATVEYYFNVACDDDCINLDLAAIEADGTEADLDDADDNGPILNIHASEYRSVLDKPKGIPRPMTVEIRMKDCNADVCAVGLRIEAVE